MPNRPASIRKIVWALDPLDSSAAIPTSLFASLSRARQAHGLSIEPVFAVGTQGVGIPAPLAEQAMVRRLKGLRIPGLQAPRVLCFDGGAVRSAVDAVVAHARKRGADLIVTSSHGSKGLTRLFLGSFAETLLLRSRIPVVIARPGFKTGTHLREIVFPTDLGPNARRGFRRVLALAKTTGAHLTLLHVVPRPIEPLIQEGSLLIGGAWMPSEQLVTDAEVMAERTLKTWVREAATKHHVKARFIVDASPRPVRDVVLERAKKADLIAMGAESGPVRAALVGSITRQVVRGARCPVWVVRG